MLGTSSRVLENIFNDFWNLKCCWIPLRCSWNMAVLLAQDELYSAHTWPNEYQPISVSRTAVGSTHTQQPPQWWTTSILGPLQGLLEHPLWPEQRETVSLAPSNQTQTTSHMLDLITETHRVHYRGPVCPNSLKNWIQIKCKNSNNLPEPIKPPEKWPLHSSISWKFETEM